MWLTNRVWYSTVDHCLTWSSLIPRPRGLLSQFLLQLKKELGYKPSSEIISLSLPLLSLTIDMDIVISGNKFVSTDHCELTKGEDGGVWITDKSTNGTLLNGSRLVRHSKVGKLVCH